MDKIDIKSVDRVVLAGAFGTHIDPKYAMVLGMIPDCVLIMSGRRVTRQNQGRMALLNKQARRDIEMVVRDIEKIETAVEPSFQDHFVKAMIPHKVALRQIGRGSACRILTDEDAPAWPVADVVVAATHSRLILV